MKTNILILLILVTVGILIPLILFVVCGKSEYTFSRSPKCVYAPGSYQVLEIPNQKLDIETCLSEGFGNSNDWSFAETLPPSILEEANLYIDSVSGHETRIYAAREIGDFILIFVIRPDMPDGGFEFIYSKKSKKVVGTFMAGYKG